MITQTVHTQDIASSTTWTADDATEAAGLALYLQLLAEARADVAAVLCRPDLGAVSLLVHSVLGNDVNDVRFSELVDGMTR